MARKTPEEARARADELRALAETGPPSERLQRELQADQWDQHADALEAILGVVARVGMADLRLRALRDVFKTKRTGRRRGWL